MSKIILLTVRESTPPQNYYANMSDLEAMIQITESAYALKKQNILHETSVVDANQLPDSAQYII